MSGEPIPDPLIKEISDAVENNIRKSNPQASFDADTATLAARFVVNGIEATGISRDEISPEKNLYPYHDGTNDLNIDSIDSIEVILYLEQEIDDYLKVPHREMGVNINDETAGKLVTVADLATLTYNLMENN